MSFADVIASIDSGAEPDTSKRPPRAISKGGFRDVVRSIDNVFDQFDGYSSKKKSGSNPFDKYDELPSREVKGKNPFDKYDVSSPKQATSSSLGWNAVSGLNEGIANTLGAPADAIAKGLNSDIHDINSVFGTNIRPIEDPFGGSKSIRRGMSRLGIATGETVEANNAAERIARGAGEGAGSLVAGAAELAVVNKLFKLAEGAPQIYKALEGLFGGPTPATAATGAAVGAGAAAGAEAAPEGYKGVGSLAGGLAGGVVPAAARVAWEGGKFAVNAAAQAARPFTKAGQEQLAGQTLRGSSSNPYQVMNNLENGPNELVAGSKPTTFQQTGDMGLGQLERRVRTNNPDDFLQRAAEQNSARRGAIEGVQATGNPTAVSAHFRGMRESLDRVTEAEVGNATNLRNQATAELGGMGREEGYGAAMRAPAQEARDAAKEAENRLWEAVDPHRDLTMPAGPIANTARNVQGAMTRSAKPMTGEERDIFEVAQSYGPNTPFQEVKDLRSRISTAMFQELRTNGRTPVYARLSQLRRSVEESIDGAIERQVRLDQRAVAQGRLPAEDTIGARLQREATEWARTRQAGEVVGSGVGGMGPRREGSVSAAFGTEVPNRLRNAEGNSRVQEASPLDEAAAERLRAASAATRERAATFDQGATGNVLRPGARAGEYRTPDSLVPSKVFHPGANGGEDVRHFVAAVGEDRAIPIIADYAASSLRRAAVRPDGSVDTAKALAWAKQHDAALAELPPAIRSRFANPGRAEEVLAQASAARKEQLETFDRSAIAKVMGTESGDVVRQVGSVFEKQNAAAQMGELVRNARGNPSAMEGLRRSVVEYIQSKYIGNTEAATSEQALINANAFQTFIKNKADVLGKVFTPDEIGNLRAVAQDIQRANRSINATKLPGGSNTAQDLANAAPQGSILNKLAVEAGAAAAGHAVTNSISGGVFGWLGTRIASSLRDAGISHVDDLIKEAMLHPELARELMKKAPAQPTGGGVERIVKTLKRISVAVASNIK
ncbi:hypothetical protein BRADO0472 [Bradyrhizobium sp. ORS 278]|uniref:hypothetical protein n=1 Tax=Bradyrhizobium sp. (strain ORS 278) TaxID=114615 RepID=UPI0001507840|nr:hypothetical protein [Bradyrhizobium sp. ORS 278]CAL74415.1 hypothetical protein BRADO0472 [Bradyrhizobium sp. ORS 278]